MKVKLVFALLALVATTVAQGHTILSSSRQMIPDSIPLNSDEMIDYINSLDTTWTVYFQIIFSF